MKKKQPTRTARLSENGTTVEIRFPYNPLDVDRCRRLPMRRFVADDRMDKHWICQPTKKSITMLKEWGFTLCPRLKGKPKAAATATKPIRPMKLTGKLAALRPFQQAAVEALERWGGRGLIADEMGLGKTAEALAVLELHPDWRPVVVVCPASVKWTWLDEIRKWIVDELHNSATVLSGTKPYNVTASIAIINYDILPAWLAHLKRGKPSVVILDEAHYIKNSHAKRTKAAFGLCKGSPHVMALTGTPVLNQPSEIYNAINILRPLQFCKRWDFLKRYCGLYHNGWGWVYDGATNTEELHELLMKSCMIRRLKADVLKELPPKVRTVVPLDIDNTHEYAQVEEDFVAWMASIGKPVHTEALVKVEMLKQIAVKGKMRAAIQWIQDWLDSDGKLVVFCHHKTTVAALRKAFKSQCVVVDGSTSQPDRRHAVLQFQNDKAFRLFIGTAAAREGLTLTAASNTCFLELWWSPGEHDQAEDRVHRIGQEADSVGAYYLLARGTIEERIARLLDRKRRVVAAVTDGTEVENEELLGSLLKQYKTRNGPWLRAQKP